MTECNLCYTKLLMFEFSVNRCNTAKVVILMPIVKMDMYYLPFLLIHFLVFVFLRVHKLMNAAKLPNIQYMVESYMCFNISCGGIASLLIGVLCKRQ